MNAIHIDRASLMTIALTRTEDVSRYGSVSLGANREIVAFGEKSAIGADRGGPRLVNAGLYLCGRDILKLPVMSQRRFSLEEDLLPDLAGKGLLGYVATGNFIDIGVPADFEAAQQLLPMWTESVKRDHSC